MKLKSWFFLSFLWKVLFLQASTLQNMIIAYCHTLLIVSRKYNFVVTTNCHLESLLYCHKEITTWCLLLMNLGTESIGWPHLYFVVNTKNYFSYNCTIGVSSIKMKCSLYTRILKRYKYKAKINMWRKKQNINISCDKNITIQPEGWWTKSVQNAMWTLS